VHYVRTRLHYTPTHLHTDWPPCWHCQHSATPPLFSPTSLVGLIFLFPICLLPLHDYTRSVRFTLRLPHFALLHISYLTRCWFIWFTHSRCLTFLPHCDIVILLTAFVGLWMLLLLDWLLVTLLLALYIVGCYSHLFPCSWHILVVVFVGTFTLSLCCCYLLLHWHLFTITPHRTVTFALPFVVLRDVTRTLRTVYAHTRLYIWFVLRLRLRSSIDRLRFYVTPLLRLYFRFVACVLYTLFFHTFGSRYVWLRYGCHTLILRLYVYLSTFVCRRCALLHTFYVLLRLVYQLHTTHVCYTFGSHVVVVVVIVVFVIPLVLRNRCVPVGWFATFVAGSVYHFIYRYVAAVVTFVTFTHGCIYYSLPHTALHYLFTGCRTLGLAHTQFLADVWRTFQLIGVTLWQIPHVRSTWTFPNLKKTALQFPVGWITMPRL